VYPTIFQPDAVVALVETSGRIDQILANINTLFKAQGFLTCALYQLASNSISWLLLPGHHELHIPSNLEGKICSLVPIGSPSKCVSSSGLKWNLGLQIKAA
jgi:thiamine pyrophosphokinase